MNDLHLSQQAALRRLYAYHDAHGWIAYASADACRMSIVDASDLHQRGLIVMRRFFEGTSAEYWLYRLTMTGKTLVEGWEI